jgi:nucleotide-binding universal stress UspA family protein
MFKRILVPVDGSRTATLGLNEAIKMATEGGATLYLLHVIDERVITQNVDAGAGMDMDMERLFQALADAAKKILARAETLVRSQNIPVKCITAETLINNVADVIVAQAKKSHADVIVLGTHGRRGLRRLVMGSDAENVVRMSPVPVLLVRSKPPRSRK